jgi:hypothetical protein
MFDLKNKDIKLEFIKNLSWPEVFEIWRQNEEGGQNWIEHFKSRGFDTWEEWRMRYAEPFRCPEANWGLYRLKNPVRDLPSFWGGPFRSWKEKFYKDRDSMTFQELAATSEIQTHGTVNDMVKSFPNPTTLSGMVVDGEVYIIEGTHRCLALALMNQRGLAHEGEVFLTLAESPGGKLPVVGLFKK